MYFEESEYPSNSHYLFPLEELGEQAECLGCQQLLYDTRPCAVCSMPLLEHTDDHRRLRHPRCQKEAQSNYHRLYQRARYHNPDLTADDRERLHEQADAEAAVEVRADLLRMTQIALGQIHRSEH